MKQANYKRSLSLMLIALMLTGVALAGCDSGDQGRTVATPPASTEKTETDRYNNANIPPQARAAAIQGMKDGRAEAQRTGQMAPK